MQYANFGLRTIAIRLPLGMPFPKSVWSQYVGIEGVAWRKDSRGKGGILTIDPCHDAGDIDEIWSPGEYLDDVVEIRNRLLNGDSRMLYLLWLCAANDQYVSPDIIEPPVPGGLAECLEPCGALMDFFGLDPLILIAAAEGATDGPATNDRTQQIDAWIDSLGNGEQKRLLRQLLTEDAAAVKAEMLASIRHSAPDIDWPMVVLGRPLHDLLERADVLRAEHNAKEEKKRQAAARRKAVEQERERQERMTQMVKEPQKWLREADNLVGARGTKNYKAAAEILADLREAIGGEKGAKLTKEHAAHLAKRHPTLTHLKSSLGKRGLLE